MNRRRGMFMMTSWLVRRLDWADSGCSAHLFSPRLAASGVRLRQQRLVRRLIGDRRRAVRIAGSDEARCHELAEQGHSRGARAIACRRAAAGGVEGGDGGGCDHDVVARSAVEDVLPPATEQHVVAVAAGQGVVAGAADKDVVAEPPLAVSSMPVSADAVMTSSPPRS